MFAFVDGVHKHAILDAPTLVAVGAAKFPTSEVFAIEERFETGFIGGKRLSSDSKRSNE